jgi:hypothetical protein
MKVSNSDYCRTYKADTKIKCFSLYGSACEQCGYDDIRALQLDHKHADAVEMQGEYRRGSTGLYLAILKGHRPTSDYQLLCANCNWIKRVEGKEGERHLFARKLTRVYEGPSLIVDIRPDLIN